MPWKYEIDRERKLVITSAWDSLTADEVLDHQRRLVKDDSFNPDFFQLLDFSRVTSFHMDTTAVTALARHEVFSRNSRRAFVAPSQLAIGMSHMFTTIHQLEGGAEQIAVFNNRNDALQWLNR